MNSQKQIIVSVTNDLSYDQRVHKVCMSLLASDFKVLLVGRKRNNSIPIEREYDIKRFRFLPEKGVLFYAFYNIRLFLFLMVKKVDVLHSNDLDTLLANWMVKIIRRKHLVYDTHEYFTGVPEIQKKPMVKKTWRIIEKMIFPRLKHVFTVNGSIADLYEKEYGVKVKVVRNLPLSEPLVKIEDRNKLNLPEDKKIIILQGGGINVDRGAEELLEAIALSEQLFLCIVGSGDVIDDLKSRAKQNDLKDKVLFTGLLQYNQMMQYTLNSDVGVTLDKDTNLNYQFSLPNKIFDYIKAGIPVVSSNLVELTLIINQYKIGLVIKSHDPKEILNTMNSVVNDHGFKNNTEKASKELIWENEVVSLLNIYKQIG